MAAFFEGIREGGKGLGGTISGHSGCKRSIG